MNKNNITCLKEAFTEKARALALENIDKAWEQVFGHTFTGCEQPASDLVDQNKKSRFERTCFNLAIPA